MIDKIILTATENADDNGRLNAEIISEWHKLYSRFQEDVNHLIAKAGGTDYLEIVNYKDNSSINIVLLFK